nr:hypothetical protein [Tanacetum cinerariifolium]
MEGLHEIGFFFQSHSVTGGLDHVNPVIGLPLKLRINRLKLDGELEVEEEIVGEEFIRSYKAIKEKNDPRVFVIPIRLEGKYDLHALVDTGSNVNVMPYRIYKKLGREQVKRIRHKITMLDHSKVDPIGRLLDVLFQVDVTTILASFFLLDIPIDRDVLIIVGRSFWHTCGAIINTIKGTTSTFNGCAKAIEEMLEIKRTTAYDKIKRNELWLMSMFKTRHQIGYANFVTRIAKKMSFLTDEVLNGLSAPIYYRSLDATTLSDLINSNGRFIAKNPSPGVPKASRPPRLTIKDLYDWMGRMEICQGTLERMSRRQSHHSIRYTGVFEYMAGQYNIPLQGAYTPPGYDEKHQQDE